MALAVLGSISPFSSILAIRLTVRRTSVDVPIFKCAVALTPDNIYGEILKASEALDDAETPETNLLLSFLKSSST